VFVGGLLHVAGTQLYGKSGGRHCLVVEVAYEAGINHICYDTLFATMGIGIPALPEDVVTDDG